MLISLASAPIAASNVADLGDDVETLSTTAQYVGTLTTQMGSKTSTVDSFSLNYGNGVLEIPSFQVGSMPGTIYVYASGLTEGVAKRCNNSVSLTIGEITTTYNANICVDYNSSNKLTVSIDVLNPIYEGLSFIAEVDFEED